MLVDSDFIYYEDAKQAKRKGSIDISTVTELKVSSTRLRFPFALRWLWIQKIA